MKTSAVSVGIDLLVEADGWPPEARLLGFAERAVAAALSEIGATALSQPPELSLVFTDDARIKALNAGWRGKDKATNVLSFPAFATRIGDALPPMLGDIVLAFETVCDEARSEGKSLEDHASHLIIHGLLHLLGHDHETDAEAERMEAIERGALRRLAIADPYA